MAVLNAQYKHPSSAYSQGLKDLIDSMLKVNPTERPDIHEVSTCVCYQPAQNLITINICAIGHPNDGSCPAVASIECGAGSHHPIFMLVQLNLYDIRCGLSSIYDFTLELGLIHLSSKDRTRCVTGLCPNCLPSSLFPSRSTR